MVRKLLESSLLILLVSVLSRGALFILNVFIVRALSPEQYGQFSIIKATSSTLEGVVSGALGPITIKEIAKKDNIDVLGAVFAVNLIFMVFISIFIVIFGDSILEIVNLESNYLSLVLIVLVFITTKCSTMLQNILFGMERYKSSAISSALSSFITILIALLIEIDGIDVAVWLIAIYYIFDFTIKVLLIWNCFHKVTASILEIINIFRSTNIFIVSMLISSATFWYSRTLLARSEGGFEELAYFDVAFQFLTVIMIITGSTTSAILPMLSGKGEGCRRNGMKLIWTSILINLILIAIFSVPLVYFSERILLIFGSEYYNESTIKLIPVVCCIALLFTGNSIFNKYAIGRGKNWIVFLASSTGCFSSVLYLLSMGIANSIQLANLFIIFYLSSLTIYLVEVYFGKR
ncbi:oligosaccharide flippase family protein [Vibrio cyclitrophicus]|uniref:oligosaccharide flippase family protein n=1 Tax=Vibrio cyclitrophicus TaxID=47951 RepID=UPI000C841FEE|nr:oligosaccharide flippase family protein [Vibrio cyclitrophicus]PMI06552.1 hypothetical protein BCU52_17700 [Vibrio cyclitrophicus]